MSIITIAHKDYGKDVGEIFNKADIGKVLSSQKCIVIKPNLVNTSPPPITTPVTICEAIIKSLRKITDAEIIIAEGTGAIDYDTDSVFDKLGYKKLSDKSGVKLIDLNNEPCYLLEDSSCKIFPQFHMPKIIMDSYLISVPVLKAHSLAIITGTLKNMMGCASPEYYQDDNHWKKSFFHRNIHPSIVELNKYRTPDFTILDAVIGLQSHHLAGPYCDPPVNKLIAGYDPIEIDRKAAELLGLDWRSIPHLHTF